MIVYLAGPLFTLAERKFNAEFAAALESVEAVADVILPQDFPGTPETMHDFAAQVFCHCLESIDRSDVVVAILDGTDADSGTCIELGYARAKGKPIVGVRTDFRAGEDRGLNVMVSQICSHLIVRPCLSAGLGQIIEEVVAALGSHVTMQVRV